jgi:hypothetical protein
MNNLPSFFIRRFDYEKIKRVMERASVHSFFDTKNIEDYKVDLIKSTVDTFFYLKHELDISGLSEKEWNPIIEFMLFQYGDVMDELYENLKIDYPMS